MWLHSPQTQQNLFLTRWLSTVQKQRRFHRDTQSDVEWLVKQGRQYGINARLVQKLEYLWNASTGTLSEQNDLFCLTYTIEQLKSQGWVNAVVSDDQWDYGLLTEEYQGTDALLVRKSALSRGFSNEGKLLTPIEFIVIGDCSACRAVFQSHALHTVMSEPGRLVLQPESQY